MDNIQSILLNKRIQVTKSKRPINKTYEAASEFGNYVGLHPIVVLRLFKLYGISQTLSIKSWLYDVPYNPKKGGKIALAHWKLKEDQKRRAVNASSKLST